jgi:hypothetical protein
MLIRRHFRKLGVALAASGAAALSLTAAPAHANSPTPVTIYALPSTTACLKGRGNCAIYPKAAQTADGKLVASFELSTVPSSGSAVGQTLPVYQSTNDGTSWSLISQVQAPAYYNSAYSKYTSAWTNPYLYVLPTAVGNLSAGTLVMAAVVSGDDEYYLEHKAANPAWVPSNDGDRENMAIALYASTNDGTSWSFENIITGGGWEGGSAGAIGIDVSTANTHKEVDPVWEPYLMAYNGQLVCYFSDEDDYTGYNSGTGALTIDPNNATATDSDGQIVAHRTWNGNSGSAWSSAVADVPGDTVSMGGGKTEIGGGRPGMANVVQTSDGQWLLTYEYWGGGANVRYKLASNPLDFFTVGGADGSPISALPVASGSSALSQGGNPVVTREPSGALLYNAGGSGDVWMNPTGSSTGAWTEYGTTLPAAYSRNLTYDANTGSIAILANEGTSTIVSAEWTAPNTTGIAGSARTLTNVNTGTCLDDYQFGTANDTSVDLWSCAGGRNQQFNIVNLGNGYFTLTNVNSGTCLDDYAAGTANGSSVDLWACDGGRNQDWSFVPVGSDYELVNESSGLCLDDPYFARANGTLTDLWACNGGTNQLWHF